MKKLSLLLSFLIIVQVNFYAQIEEGSFEFEGEIRNYAVFLPQNFKPDMPVVITLHGWNETLKWCMDYIDMNSVADTMGFVVVYPAAIWPGFNSGCINLQYKAPNVDDVGFISNLIDTIHTKYGIDLKRVYCCGLSNGGNMAHKIASQIGYRFAAVADVLGAMNDRIANDYYKIRSLPILICHGTADILCPYDGDTSRQQWSTEETVKFWLENNGCVLAVDTVSLPDIDTLDGCTIDKISYRNCEDSTEVVFYRGIDMGHSWPSSTFRWGTDEGNKNKDINASVEVLNFFKNYKNPLVDLVFGRSLDVSHKYFPPQGDTLILNALLTNPANHPVAVYALIKGDENDFQDSIKLFDDGFHNDGNASDNIWGEAKWLSDLGEDFFTIKAYTNDSTENISLLMRSINHFTTAGPIEVDTFSLEISRDSLLTVKNFKITNKGTVKTVENVKVEIKTSDTTVTGIHKNSSDFGDIAAGDSKTVSSAFYLYVDKDVDPDSIEFEFEISSNGIVYWLVSLKDTVTVDVENKLDYLPNKFVLEQNFPNPFNPSTTIRYSIPKQANVTLKIYDVLGKEVTTLVNEEKPAGIYEVEFNGHSGLSPWGEVWNLSSGVYFYQIKASDFVKTKKMIFLK